MRRKTTKCETVMLICVVSRKENLKKNKFLKENFTGEHRNTVTVCPHACRVLLGAKVNTGLENKMIQFLQSLEHMESLLKLVRDLNKILLIAVFIIGIWISIRMIHFEQQV